MKQTYRIVGIRSLDGFKKLELQPMDEMVQENKEVNLGDIMKNIGGFTKETARRFQKYQSFDVIRVSDLAFSEGKYELDGLFTIEF